CRAGRDEVAVEPAARKDARLLAVVALDAAALGREEAGHVDDPHGRHSPACPSRTMAVAAAALAPLPVPAPCAGRPGPTAGRSGVAAGRAAAVAAPPWAAKNRRYS